MNIHDGDRFVLVSCRGTMPRVSELLDRDRFRSH
jgi:hypothetical protein